MKNSPHPYLLNRKISAGSCKTNNTNNFLIKCATHIMKYILSLGYFYLTLDFLGLQFSNIILICSCRKYCVSIVFIKIWGVKIVSACIVSAIAPSYQRLKTVSYQAVKDPNRLSCQRFKNAMSAFVKPKVYGLAEHACSPLFIYVSISFTWNILVISWQVVWGDDCSNI